jgi:hypothetical protein
VISSLRMVRSLAGRRSSAWLLLLAVLGGCGGDGRISAGRFHALDVPALIAGTRVAYREGRCYRGGVLPGCDYVELLIPASRMSAAEWMTRETKLLKDTGWTLRPQYGILEADSPTHDVVPTSIDLRLCSSAGGLVGDPCVVASRLDGQLARARRSSAGPVLELLGQTSADL